MTRFRLFISLVIATASASAAASPDGVEQIRACLKALVENKSSHVVEGRLVEPWSAAWTIRYSESDLTFVSIRHTLEVVEHPEPDRLTHDWAILCTVDRANEVVSLVSPESDDLVQFLDGEKIEDRAYEQIAESLRAKKAVYRIDAQYQIAANDIMQFGGTEKSRVNPSDFGVN